MQINKSSTKSPECIWVWEVIIGSTNSHVAHFLNKEQRLLLEGQRGSVSFNEIVAKFNYSIATSLELAEWTLISSQS